MRLHKSHIHGTDYALDGNSEVLGIQDILNQGCYALLVYSYEEFVLCGTDWAKPQVCRVFFGH